MYVSISYDCWLVLTSVVICMVYEYNNLPKMLLSKDYTLVCLLWLVVEFLTVVLVKSLLLNTFLLLILVQKRCQPWAKQMRHLICLQYQLQQPDQCHHPPSDLWLLFPIDFSTPARWWKQVGPRMHSWNSQSTLWRQQRLPTDLVEPDRFSLAGSWWWSLVCKFDQHLWRQMLSKSVGSICKDILCMHLDTWPDRKSTGWADIVVEVVSFEVILSIIEHDCRWSRIYQRWLHDWWQ